MNSASSFYQFKPAATEIDNRFDEFIRWAEPSGGAGFNHVHDDPYDPFAPFFQLAPRLVQDANKTARLWFVKREYLGDSSKAYTVSSKSADIISLDFDKVIGPCTFLRFSKAFLNVVAHIRQVRSQPKPLLRALIFLEKALREENNENNSPVLLRKSTFVRAVDSLAESHYGTAVTYDAGKELELIAGMLQGGYRTSSFNFANGGFQLLERQFSFASTLPSRAKRKVIQRNKSLYDTPDNPGRLTNAQVACVGLAYRLANERYGKRHFFTFITAIAGLTLTTTSMRMSELVRLRRDCLFTDKEPSKNESRPRSKIRIYRPKIDESQQVPLPFALDGLAHELHEVLLDYSNEAHKAFRFYVSRFGAEFQHIDELYVPADLRPLMAKEWLTKPELDAVLGTSGGRKKYVTLPQWLFGKITVHRFVSEPGDVHPVVPDQKNNSTKLLPLGKLLTMLKDRGYRVTVPAREDRSKYVNITAARRLLNGWVPLERIVECLASGKTLKAHVRTEDLKSVLLGDFKSRDRFPHWPYLDKEKKVPLDRALLVYFAPLMNKGDPRTIIRSEKWWCPVPVSSKQINMWLNRDAYSSGRGGWVFKALDIRDGDAHLAVGVHATRKYHQTQALLSGANEIFIDLLAGRKTGSAHYDLRTVQELLLQSLDTFDPDSQWQAVGPAVEGAPPETSIVDRRVFLYENAAPKHVTEIGGCSSDWSLTPCKLHGDCMRCDLSVWSKGDKKRIERINDIYAENLRVKQVAEQKIADGHDFDAVKRRLQQALDTIARCEAIFEVEADEDIPVGTIVTFSAAPGAQTDAGRVQWLRQLKLPSEEDNDE